MEIQKMNNSIDCTNEVKRKKVNSNLILILTYLAVWIVLVAFYWGVLEPYAWYLKFIIYYILLPVTSLVISIFIGKKCKSLVYDLVLILFFGFMNMLAEYFTYSISIKLFIVVFRKGLGAPFLMMTLPGMLGAFIGMMIGLIIRKATTRKVDKLAV